MSGDFPDQDLDASKRWFQEARFGMFIHWGIYAQLGGRWKGRTAPRTGEGIYMPSRADLTEEEYFNAAAKNFRADHFDADRWVRLAKRAGMRYITITAKHLDGFAMYHSHVDQNVVDDTPFGRDPIAELARACDENGLKLGIYYSQVSDYWAEDLKRGDTEAHLQRKNLPQLTELLTQYGEICELWFDGSPKKLTRRQQERVYRHVKGHQKGCLTTNRLSNVWFDVKSMLDNQAPAMPVEGVWEAPGTMNDTWGFKYDDHHWKSAATLITILIDCVSKGGNYLLNVGPDGNGRFPAESVERLRSIGEWMDMHGESIYGCVASPWVQDPPWGLITRKGSTLYLHVLEAPTDDALHLSGLKTPVRRAAWLADGRELATDASGCPGANVPRLTIQLAGTPDTLIPVIKLELAEDPEVDDGLVQRPDGSIYLPAHRAQASRPVMSDEGSGPTLTDGGMLAWWKNEAYSARWNVRVHQPGKFRVSIHSPNFWHKEFYVDWMGGAELRLRCGESSTRGVLEGGRKGKTPRWLYYDEHIIELGQLEIPRAGIVEVTLDAPHIPIHRPAERDYGFAVSEVRLYPV
ncbi:MAG: alpha-L-fucosidase [Candidatus Brocadiia bacterium]